MEIFACPKCGSRKIFQGKMKDGVLTGYSDRNVCRDCGFQGQPIIFNSEKDYQSFLHEVKEYDTDNIKKENNISDFDFKDLTDEEKEIVEYVNRQPIKEEKNSNKPPHVLIILFIMTLIYGLWLMALIISYFMLFNRSLIFEQFIIIIYLSLLISIFISVIYGYISRKKWAYTLSGTFFIMALPLGILFLYYLTRPNVKKYFNII